MSGIREHDVIVDEDEDIYSDYEEEFGSGGFEKFAKSNSRGESFSKGKKRVKPRQEFDQDF
jgi:hypothetical protein